MNRIEFIHHKGKQILHLNFTRANSAKVIQIIHTAKAVIAAQPGKSLRALTDAAEMSFADGAAAALKEFESPAAAVVGITGLKQIIYNAFC